MCNLTTCEPVRMTGATDPDATVNHPMFSGITAVPDPITYDLRAGATSSDRFYALLSDTASEVLEHLFTSAEEILHQYAFFCAEDQKEPPRSLGEYAVEFLTIGTSLIRYGEAARQTPGPVISLLKLLFRIRSVFKPAKPFIDSLRGLLSGGFLVPHAWHATGTASDRIPDKKHVDRLVEWLAASGEFKDEVKRLRNWTNFFATLENRDVTACLENALREAEWFIRHAGMRFDPFTAGIERFLNTELRAYRYREDALFCGKTAVDYCVNMIASDIMNRGLAREFAETSRKIVLVPGCMRLHDDDRCRAVYKGQDITCSGCSEDCNVNRITRLGVRREFTVRIIPHSSGFTSWLRRYEHQRHTGVVAIACTLNIVAGGYEMRELGIPSQCVMLDYCGCKKHWDPAGRATDVNERQIIRKIQGK